MLHILSSFALVIVKCLPNDGVCEGLVVLIFDIPIIVLGLENFLVVVNRRLALAGGHSTMVTQ